MAQKLHLLISNLIKISNQKKTNTATANAMSVHGTRTNQNIPPQEPTSSMYIYYDTTLSLFFLTNIIASTTSITCDFACTSHNNNHNINIIKKICWCL